MGFYLTVEKLSRAVTCCKKLCFIVDKDLGQILNRMLFRFSKGGTKFGKYILTFTVKHYNLFGITVFVFIIKPSSGTFRCLTGRAPA